MGGLESLGRLVCLVAGVCGRFFCFLTEIGSKVIYQVRLGRKF